MNLTILILFAPLPLLILYVRIRLHLKRRKQSSETTQCAEKPYEPETPRPPNFFLSRFPLTTQLYLRQQWTVARFGFFATLWMLTVLLCSSLFPPFSSNLPTADQRVWFGFLSGASIGSTGFPILIAFFAALITITSITTSSATFTRTRPLSLRIIFWGRILPAVAVLLLASVVSIGISFCILRVAYGPVWHSVPTASTADSAFQAVIHMDNDGTATLSEVRRLLWLARNPAPRIFASALTTMTLFFSAFVLTFCQPFQGNKNFSSGIARWIVPGMIFGVACVSSILSKMATSSPSLKHLMRLLFCNLPLQAPPPWRFLPVPIVLSLALLFLSERLHLRRDI